MIGTTPAAGRLSQGGAKLRDMLGRVSERTVRRAGPDDAPAIAALVNDAYQVERSFKRGDRTTEAEVRRLLGEGSFLVLDHPESGLAASVFVSASGRRGRFGLLSVKPALQGLGLGRRLIGVAELFCRAQGCEVMELSVVNLREELPPFYRSLGYEECGTAPFPTEPGLERPVHFIVMEKPLDRAP